MFQSRILGSPALCCEVVPASLRQESRVCTYSLASAILMGNYFHGDFGFFSLLVACGHCVLFKNAIKVKC